MLNSEQSRPLLSRTPSPDLAAIAATLNKAAQALLDASNPAEAKNESEKKTARREEIRCYRFPSLAIQCEQELFKNQGAENLQEVLYNASSSLTAFAALLERIDAEAQLEGIALHMLARELKRVGNLLFKIQDAYSTVTLVNA